MLVTNAVALLTHISRSTRIVLVEAARSRFSVYDFAVGLSEAASNQKNTAIKWNNAVGEHAARNLFQKSRSPGQEICPIVMNPLSGCPQVLNDEILKATVEEDNRQTFGELAECFQVSDEPVRLVPHREGLQLSKRVPHRLSETNNNE